MSQKPTYEELEKRVLELEKFKFESKIALDALREDGKGKKYLNINKIPIAVVIHNADSRIIDCNPKAIELLGLPENQMLQKTAIDPDWKFLNSDGAKMPLEEYPANQVLAKQKSIRDVTVGICRPDKADPVWVLANADPVFDYNGNIQQVIVIFLDITERRQAEEALQNNERFLNAIFDSIQDGISVIDIELNIVRTNQTMKNWYSHMVPLEGKKCYEAYHGRSKACSVCPTLRAIKTRKLEMDEVPLSLTKGAKGTLELFAFPMLNEASEPVAIVEFVRDITRRKDAENLLNEREQVYRSLFENNVSVILMIDPNTAQIVDANPSACSYYGYSKEALTTMRITDINGLPLIEVYQEMDKAHSEEKNYFNFRHRLSDGTTRDVEVFSGPITVSGKPLLCSIIHDISERKKAEMDRERLINELKKTLAEVKTLRGFLPICSSCKKIRDDRGYWNQIEAYIHSHTEAQFSHSICPDCAKKIYPYLDIQHD